MPGWAWFLCGVAVLPLGAYVAYMMWVYRHI
jgi:hypothetical protein